jgi:prophage regulatory protein
MDRLLKLPEVQKYLPLSRTRIYELIAAGSFPPNVKISERGVAWRESDIIAYINGKRDWTPPKPLKKAA